MNKRAEKLLEILKKQYLDFSENVPRLRNADLGTRASRIYVRKMVCGNFCMANMDFSDSVKGQGVLTAFIEFIKANPFDYKGIEVECIHNPRLAQKLRNEGFVDKYPNQEDFGVPTLVFPLKELKMDERYADHPPIPEMLIAERKGVTFADVLNEVAGQKEFVSNFDRLTGYNLSLKGSQLDLKIDESTGRLEQGIEEFIHFCWKYVFLTY